MMTLGSRQVIDACLLGLLPYGPRPSHTSELRHGALPSAPRPKSQPVSGSKHLVRHPEFMPILANAPWKLLEHLPLLAQKERGLRPHIEAARPNASGALTADAPAPFTPLSPEQAKALEATLAVAHDFLQVLGVAYILIAGSLLGAVRHLDRIPWDDDVDLCVDAAHEMQLVTLAVHLEAQRLQLPAPPAELSLRGRRALALLRAKQHRIEARETRPSLYLSVIPSLESSPNTFLAP